MPAPKYTAERRYALIEQLLNQVSALPGVTSASFTSELPLRAGGSTAAFSLQSPILASPVQVQASPRLISPAYFQTMRMRLVAGRALADTDTQDGEPVAIVNHQFALRYLGDTPPLSIRIPMGIGYQTADSSAAIVGVVDDVRYAAANDVSQPEIYYSYRQLGGRMVTPVATLMIRAAGDARALAAPVRAIVRAADPGLVADPVSTMDDRLSVIVASPRLYAVLLGAFASFALVVAAVGLFGVLSYSVSQRSRELAVRAALGAGRGELVRLVLRQGMAVTGAGAAIGIGASLLIAPSIRALLYGVTAFDRMTFVVVPVVLVIVALLACLGPALRAGRVDPIEELKAG
jgi:putative ABC transport system permease protein